MKKFNIDKLYFQTSLLFKVSTKCYFKTQKNLEKNFDMYIKH